MASYMKDCQDIDEKLTACVKKVLEAGKSADDFLQYVGSVSRFNRYRVIMPGTLESEELCDAVMWAVRLGSELNSLAGEYGYVAETSISLDDVEGADSENIYFLYFALNVRNWEGPQTLVCDMLDKRTRDFLEQDSSKASGA